MSETSAKTTPNTAESQGSRVVTFANDKALPKDYNLDKIEDFLSLVFGDELNPEEEIMTWVVNAGGFPKYPIAEEDMFKRLAGTQEAKALYFGTSTVSRTTDGDLRNLKKQFSRLHVVVLDDIGTKVLESDIPEDMQPSYIIESSKGNYQYGYVLDTPIDILAAAEALVQLVYDAGVSDGGGKMPNKLVRMPEGVNGKKGEKMNFVSTIKHTSDRKFKPQELLDGFSIDAEWSDILEDAEAVLKNRKAREGMATSLWSPVKPQAASYEGIIDPVLEWLYEQDYVKCEANEWVTVRCPWSDGHSSGDGTAGYKPLGRGDMPNQRGFHCFHDSCSTNKIMAFLDWVASASGIEVSSIDHSAEYVSKFVLDTSAAAGRVWDISRKKPTNMSLTSFKAKYVGKSGTVATAEGKVKQVKATTLWEHAAARVVIDGEVFDPSENGRIIERNGGLLINSFTPPDHKKVKVDMAHVDKFLGHIDYLMPIDEEREYFKQWLFAKVQDFTFRGIAIVMHTPIYGVGRSTLNDMIRTLLGVNNVAATSFNEIVSGGDFNEWEAAPFVICEETSKKGSPDYYSNYEKLKELIDPRARKVVINPKFGVKYDAMAYTSYLFTSNNPDAIVLPEGDRRFYVIANTIRRNPPAYFEDLNNWLDSNNNEWADHVYTWIMQQEVDVDALMSPPKASISKMQMIGQSQSIAEAYIKAFQLACGSSYTTSSILTDTLAAIQHLDPKLAELGNPNKCLNAAMKSSTVTLGDMTVRAPRNGRVKVFVGTQGILPQDLNNADMAGKKRVSAEISEEIRKYMKDTELLHKNVLDQLDKMVYS